MPTVVAAGDSHRDHPLPVDSFPSLLNPQRRRALVAFAFLDVPAISVLITMISRIDLCQVAVTKSDGPFGSALIMARKRPTGCSVSYFHRPYPVMFLPT